MMYKISRVGLYMVCIFTRKNINFNNYIMKTARLKKLKVFRTGIINDEKFARKLIKVVLIVYNWKKVV